MGVRFSVRDFMEAATSVATGAVEGRMAGEQIRLDRDIKKWQLAQEAQQQELTQRNALADSVLRNLQYAQNPDEVMKSVGQSFGGLNTHSAAGMEALLGAGGKTAYPSQPNFFNAPPPAPAGGGGPSPQPPVSPPDRHLLPGQKPTGPNPTPPPATGLNLPPQMAGVGTGAPPAPPTPAPPAPAPYPPPQSGAAALHQLRGAPGPLGALAGVAGRSADTAQQNLHALHQMRGAPGPLGPLAGAAGQVADQAAQQNQQMAQGATAADHTPSPTMGPSGGGTNDAVKPQENTASPDAAAHLGDNAAAQQEKQAEGQGAAPTTVQGVEGQGEEGFTLPPELGFGRQKLHFHFYNQRSADATQKIVSKFFDDVSHLADSDSEAVQGMKTSIYHDLRLRGPFTTQEAADAALQAIEQWKLHPGFKDYKQAAVETQTDLNQTRVQQLRTSYHAQPVHYLLNILAHAPEHNRESLTAALLAARDFYEARGLTFTLNPDDYDEITNLLQLSPKDKKALDIQQDLADYRRQTLSVMMANEENTRARTEAAINKPPAGTKPYNRLAAEEKQAEDELKAAQAAYHKWQSELPKKSTNEEEVVKSAADPVNKDDPDVVARRRLVHDMRAAEIHLRSIRSEREASEAADPVQGTNPAPAPAPAAKAAGVPLLPRQKPGDATRPVTRPGTPPAHRAAAASTPHAAPHANSTRIIENPAGGTEAGFYAKYKKAFPHLSPREWREDARAAAKLAAEKRAKRKAQVQ